MSTAEETEALLAQQRETLVNVRHALDVALRQIDEDCEPIVDGGMVRYALKLIRTPGLDAADLALKRLRAAESSVLIWKRIADERHAEIRRLENYRRIDVQERLADRDSIEQLRAELREAIGHGEPQATRMQTKLDELVRHRFDLARSLEAAIAAAETWRDDRDRPSNYEVARRVDAEFRNHGI